MVELGPNLIRTYVPVLVGGIASWLTARGIHVDAATQSELVVAMTSIFTAAYYTVARVLEERFPQLGAVLLGYRPAQHLGPADEYPEPAEGEQWPPAEQPAAGGTGQFSYLAPDMSQQQPVIPQPAAQQGSLADIVACTPPAKARGPRTGAIPAYRRPPGR